MKSPFRRTRIGVAASQDEICVVAFVGQQIVWRHSESRDQTMLLQDDIKRALLQYPRRRFLVCDVVCAVSVNYYRTRILRGVPSGLSRDDVHELTITNQERFFASPFAESAMASVKRTPLNEWQAAIIDRKAAQALHEGCRTAGHRLCAIIPDCEALSSNGEHSDVALGCAGGLIEAAAIGAARYDLSTGLVLVPNEVLADQRSASIVRLRVAGGVFLLAMVFAWLGSSVRNTISDYQDHKHLANLSQATRSTQAAFDTLVRVTDAIAVTADEMRTSIDATREFARLESLLPDNVILQSVRMDSSGVETSLLTTDAAVVIAALAKFDPAVQIVGMITREASPNNLERVVVRFVNRQTKARRKGLKTNSRGSFK